MEIRVGYINAFCFASGIVILLACALKLLNWVWFRPNKLERFLRRQGFSGNSYKLFHGDIKEFSRINKEARSKPISFSDDILPRILPFKIHIISKYGNNCFTWLGPTPIVNITNPKLIKEILLNQDTFQRPKVNPLMKLLVTGMLTYEGQQWSKVRKTANPAFHQDKLKDMMPKIYKSCDEMIKKWKTFVLNKESYELDVWPYIQTLTADVISRIAFGSNFEDGRKIFELLTKQIKLSIEAVQSVYIPGWRFLPTSTNRKLYNNHNQIRELIKGIINKREEALKVEKASNDDLLGLLMESNHKRIEEKEVGMSFEEVVEECKLFYLAGQETTGSLLLWTLVLLCMHPHWQERAREEVFRVFGNKDPKFDELNHLKVVSQILYEVLRLYSPAIVFTRACHKKMKLGEIILPAGILISMPIILVHHDHEYWGDDAKDFNPDRFSQGVSKAIKNHEMSFLPFGGGPRICIGQNLALLEAKLALAMILQNFSLQLSPTYIHAPTRRGLLYPQHGAPMVLHKI